MSQSSRPAFTLRFRDEETHRTLRLTAEVLGVSMNELAEAAIAHELAIIGADLEQKLTRTTELLSSYRGEGLDEDIEAFTQAETSVDDPLQSRLSGEADEYGIEALFARPRGGWGSLLERGKPRLSADQWVIMRRPVA